MHVQGKATLSSSKVRQCFNQLNSSHEIYCCESFIQSKFDAKLVNLFGTCFQMFGTKHSKTN